MLNSKNINITLNSVPIQSITKIIEKTTKGYSKNGSINASDNDFYQNKVIKPFTKRRG